MIIFLTLAVGAVTLLANLVVFGLVLKVYTEVMEERAQQRRAKRRAGDPS